MERKTFYNDVSMVINGKLIVLIEHQSTPNKNMPLRCLEYYVHLLYGIVPPEARYKNALYEIPTPEFYVFYNGGREGVNLPVVQKCDILKQYCNFIEIVARYKAELKNQSTEEGMNNWAAKAIEEAISKNILADYLTRNGTEVRNMLQAEYDYDLDMKVKTQEAREEARAEGLAEGIEEGQQQKAIETAKNALALNLSPEIVSKISELSLEKVLELQKQL